jgi:drug/metabolite transporter (DMT)-like permease
VIAQTSIVAALIAALLFGASTPFAKLLVGDVLPILLAGLLYLGSGLGLWLLRLVRDRGLSPPRLAARDWFWFLGAIAAGGVLGPLLLMYGLTRTTAADASLLLNLEAVFTALLAWIVFGENAGRRVILGMSLIVVGGAILAWSPGAMAPSAGRGAYRDRRPVLGAG